MWRLNVCLHILFGQDLHSRHSSGLPHHLARLFSFLTLRACDSERIVTDFLQVSHWLTGGWNSFTYVLFSNKSTKLNIFWGILTYFAFFWNNVHLQNSDHRTKPALNLLKDCKKTIHFSSLLPLYDSLYLLKHTLWWQLTVWYLRGCV